MAADLVKDEGGYTSDWDASDVDAQISGASAATLTNAIELNREESEVQVSPPTTGCDGVGGVGDTQQEPQRQSDPATTCAEAVADTMPGEVHVENTSSPSHIDIYIDGLADNPLGVSNIGESRLPKTPGFPAIARRTSISRIEATSGSNDQHTPRTSNLLERCGEARVRARVGRNLVTPSDDSDAVSADVAQVVEQRGGNFHSKSTPDGERTPQGSSTVRVMIPNEKILDEAVHAVAQERKEGCSARVLAQSRAVDHLEGAGVRENQSRDDRVEVEEESYADNRSSHISLPSKKGENDPSSGQVCGDSGSSRSHSSTTGTLEVPLDITMPTSWSRSPQPPRRSTVQKGDICADKTLDTCRVQITNQDVTSLNLAQLVENALLLQGAADESRVQAGVCSAISPWSLTFHRCRLPSLLPVAGLLDNLSKLCSLEINGCSGMVLTGLERVLEDATCLCALTLRRCGISQLPLLPSESIEVSQLHIYDES